MTIAWADVEAGIEAWANAVLGSTLSASHIVWRNRKKQLLRAPYLDLAITAERSIGVDDVAYEVVIDGATQRVIPRVTGLREITVEMRVRSRDQGPSAAARALLERLRASLYHPAYRAHLEAAGLAFLEAEPLRTFDFLHDERAESLASLEVRLGLRSDLFDTEADGVDFVESIELATNDEPAEIIP